MDTLSKCRELLSDKPSGGVCSYALIGGTTFPIVTKKYASPCMQALNYGTDDNRGVKGVVIFSNSKTSDEVYRKYLGYILSKESPWRDLVTVQPRQDFEEIVKKAYILTSLDFPANYVANFLTAFRLCEEKPFLGTLLIRLMSDGVSFGASSIITTFVSGVSAEGLITLRSDSWHHAFDGHIPAKDTIRRINEGRPMKEKLNQLFSTRTNYTPCNIIWGHGSKDIYSDFRSFVAEKSRKKSIKRVFPDPRAPGQTITYEGLLAYGRAVDSGEITF